MKASLDITTANSKIILSGEFFSKFTTTCLAAITQLLIATSASAAVIDLSTNVTTSGTDVNGTIYEQLYIQPAGSGVFKPFLRIQANGTEDGYNADYAGPPETNFDEKTGPHTHSLQFSDLIYIEKDGDGYYEFLLDINEQNNANRYLSLDDVRVYNTGASPFGVGNLDDFPTNLANLGLLLYDMDNSTTVKLNHALAEGSGTTDMAMYIRASYFNGVDANDYISFYSSFGTPIASDAGFEEWGLRDCSTCKPPHEVPESSTIVLMALGMLGLFAIRRRSSVEPVHF